MIFGLFFIDWVYYPVSWEYMLGSKMLAVLLALQVGYSESNNFKIKSISLYLIICELVIFIEYLVYLRITHCSLLFALIQLIFIPCFFWVWLREYNIKSDDYNKDNICILFLRPKNNLNYFSLIRLFFGLPVSSVCIIADGKVWAYRKVSGVFSISEYNGKWLKTHILLDTNIETSQQIINELNKVIGNKRFPYVKCIYSIRGILKVLGNGYEIRSILDFIPGFYALRINKKRSRND